MAALTSISLRKTTLRSFGVDGSQIQLGTGRADLSAGLPPTTLCGVCAVAARPMITQIPRINENRVTLPLLRRSRGRMREALYQAAVVGSTAFTSERRS